MRSRRIESNRVVDNQSNRNNTSNNVIKSGPSKWLSKLRKSEVTDHAERINALTKRIEVDNHLMFQKPINSSRSIFNTNENNLYEANDNQNGDEYTKKPLSYYILKPELFMELHLGREDLLRYQIDVNDSGWATFFRCYRELLESYEVFRTRISDRSINPFGISRFNKGDWLPETVVCAIFDDDNPQICSSCGDLLSDCCSRQNLSCKNWGRLNVEASMFRDICDAISAKKEKCRHCNNNYTFYSPNVLTDEDVLKTLRIIKNEVKLDEFMTVFQEKLDNFIETIPIMASSAAFSGMIADFLIENNHPESLENYFYNLFKVYQHSEDTSKINKKETSQKTRNIKQEKQVFEKNQAGMKIIDDETFFKAFIRSVNLFSKLHHPKHFVRGVVTRMSSMFLTPTFFGNEEQNYAQSLHLQTPAMYYVVSLLLCGIFSGQKIQAATMFFHLRGQWMNTYICAYLFCAIPCLLLEGYISCKKIDVLDIRNFQNQYKTSFREEAGAFNQYSLAAEKKWSAMRDLMDVVGNVQSSTSSSLEENTNVAVTEKQVTDSTAIRTNNYEESNNNYLIEKVPFGKQIPLLDKNGSFPAHQRRIRSRRNSIVSQQRSSQQPSSQQRNRWKGSVESFGKQHPSSKLQRPNLDTHPANRLAEQWMSGGRSAVSMFKSFNSDVIPHTTSETNTIRRHMSKLIILNLFLRICADHCSMSFDILNTWKLHSLSSVVHFFFWYPLLPVCNPDSDYIQDNNIPDLIQSTHARSEPDTFRFIQYLWESRCNFTSYDQIYVSPQDYQEVSSYHEDGDQYHPGDLYSSIAIMNKRKAISYGSVVYDNKSYTDDIYADEAFLDDWCCLKQYQAICNGQKPIFDVGADRDCDTPSYVVPPFKDIGPANDSEYNTEIIQRQSIFIPHCFTKSAHQTGIPIDNFFISHYYRQIDVGSFHEAELVNYDIDLNCYCKYLDQSNCYHSHFCVFDWDTYLCEFSPMPQYIEFLYGTRGSHHTRPRDIISVMVDHHEEYLVKTNYFLRFFFVFLGMTATILIPEIYYSLDLKSKLFYHFFGEGNREEFSKLGNGTNFLSRSNDEGGYKPRNRIVPGSSFNSPSSNNNHQPIQINYADSCSEKQKLNGAQKRNPAVKFKHPSISLMDPTAYKHNQQSNLSQVERYNQNGTGFAFDYNQNFELSSLGTFENTNLHHRPQKGPIRYNSTKKPFSLDYAINYQYLETVLPKALQNAVLMYRAYIIRGFLCLSLTFLIVLIAVGFLNIDRNAQTIGELGFNMNFLFPTEYQKRPVLDRRLYDDTFAFYPENIEITCTPPSCDPEIEEEPRDYNNDPVTKSDQEERPMIEVNPNFIENDNNVLNPSLQTFPNNQNPTYWDEDFFEAAGNGGIDYARFIINDLSINWQHQSRITSYYEEGSNYFRCQGPDEQILNNYLKSPTVSESDDEQSELYYLLDTSYFNEFVLYLDHIVAIIALSLGRSLIGCGVIMQIMDQFGFGRDKTFISELTANIVPASLFTSMADFSIRRYLLHFQIVALSKNAWSANSLTAMNQDWTLLETSRRMIGDQLSLFLNLEVLTTFNVTLVKVILPLYGGKLMENRTFINACFIFGKYSAKIWCICFLTSHANILIAESNRGGSFFSLGNNAQNNPNHDINNASVRKEDPYGYGDARQSMNENKHENENGTYATRSNVRAISSNNASIPQQETQKETDERHQRYLKLLRCIPCLLVPLVCWIPVLLFEADPTAFVLWCQWVSMYVVTPSVMLCIIVECVHRREWVLQNLIMGKRCMLLGVKLRMVYFVTMVIVPSISEAFRNRTPLMISYEVAEKSCEMHADFVKPMLFDDNSFQIVTQHISGLKRVWKLNIMIHICYIFVRIANAIAIPQWLSKGDNHTRTHARYFIRHIRNAWLTTVPQHVIDIDKELELTSSSEEQYSDDDNMKIEKGETIDSTPMTEEDSTYISNSDDDLYDDNISLDVNSRRRNRYYQVLSRSKSGRFKMPLIDDSDSIDSDSSIEKQKKRSQDKKKESINARGKITLSQRC